ncbi:MAG TPA: hypothetical protein VJP86_00705 [Vicinamibacterales bacterium]|jgi:hypothetical protein|nr:hypothetical protein [Vicinamibacterales bacterium]
METHVKVLAVLHIVSGAFLLAGALIVLVIFGGAAGIASVSGDPDAAAAVPIVGIVGAAIFTICLLLSLPGIVIGIGLWQRRSWARIGGIVLSFLSLAGFPFWTALGVYGFWVLFSRETEQMFAPA